MDANYHRNKAQKKTARSTIELSWIPSVSIPYIPIKETVKRTSTKHSDSLQKANEIWRTRNSHLQSMSLLKWPMNSSQLYNLIYNFIFQIHSFFVFRVGCAWEEKHRVHRQPLRSGCTVSLFESKGIRWSCSKWGFRSNCIWVQESASQSNINYVCLFVYPSPHWEKKMNVLTFHLVV